MRVNGLVVGLGAGVLQGMDAGAGWAGFVLPTPTATPEPANIPTPAPATRQ